MIKEKLLRIRFFSKLREWILFVRDYNKNHELHKCYGSKNKDIVFFVIRNYTKEAGWGSILNYVCRNIKYAIDRGYTPVVDMQNYHNAYEIPGEFGKVNVWEKYFHQLCDFTLEEVYKSKNVILCGSQLSPMGYITYGKDPDWKEYADLFNLYIRLKDEVKTSIDDEIDRVTKINKLENVRTLGVLCRGTDYTNLKPLYHYIPYTADESIEEVNIRIGQYDRIYLATEDNDILERFVQSIDKGKLYYTEQERYSPNDVSGYLADVSKQLGMDQDKRSVDYLKILYALGSCNSLLGAPCGGTYIALLINNDRYEENTILSKGQYL